MLAEFKYGLEPKETFGDVFDQAKSNRYFSQIYYSFDIPFDGLL